MNQTLERWFEIRSRGSNVRTELLAGLTTFLTMAYILFVNPDILAAAGMPRDSVFVATALAAAFGSILMGVLANYPIALAPGMGINAYFAFVVVQGMGVPWQTALGAVFLSGLLFVLVSVFQLRAWLVDAIPRSLKFSISAGIGLFLGLIALKSAGLVVSDASTLVRLGEVHSPSALLAMLGLVLMVALQVRGVKSAILIGILSVTALSMGLGLQSFQGVLSMPPSIAPTWMQMDLKGALEMGLVAVVMTFFLVEVFDATGTLIGVSHRAGLLDQDGRLPRLNRALLADSTAILAGATLGTSSTTAYVESAAGTAVGGRTGLTAIVVGLLFLLALFFAPLAASIPSYATAPALLVVALMMTRGLAEIDWEDFTESAPAVMCALMMPFTFSIANGIAAGFISYVAIKLLAGRWRQVSIATAVVALIFVARFVWLSH